MNTSKRCEMYCAILLENNQAELALVSEDHVGEIAYMMAGAICYAEHQYEFYVSDSDISNVASEAANMLVNRPKESPTSKQMPLVLTAIQRYREFATPQLGGQQTLAHRGMQQDSEVNSLLSHCTAETEVETTSDAQRRNSKRKNHVFSISKVVNSLISLWRRR
ncbi:TPA: hypothetical protein NG682_002994 [Vibrio parahaemolyticus]|uniref:hypothetical protein n=1 Tax=Vibrio parahaemolyticus TaxID=670 RepID=UPI0011205B82|nr:hypothetical protein [Vibrio parahaemolyticus]MDF4940377.1 hypothetical protein [Vibrio parahaemolyticus]TOK36571.1 hypothetical protein CGI20_17335 [Vibrio parahaemolyticus]HCE3704263.1 hypothetical protein [Vibrio parahaemolyticus]HCG6653118.1 hypothetical protein [Vibrio parahaemolyticus]